MTEEEFRRLKEEEKEHLRQMRALKNAVKLVERQRSVTSALEEMTSRSRAALEANERLIEEIAFDTAQNEARLDIALESTAASDALDAEEEAAALRARALVEETRRNQEASEKSGAQARQVSPEEPNDRPESLPEKTLGRLR